VVVLQLKETATVTKSELIAALGDLADDTPVVLDAGIGTYLDLQVHLDDEGVRLAPADDAEGQDFIAAARAAFA